MNLSTGHEDRSYEPIGGVVLPDVKIGSGIPMSFFVDLHEDVVFVLPRGGLDSYLFWESKDLWHLEDIDQVGVFIERYFNIFNQVAMFHKMEEDVPDISSPLPPAEDVEEKVLRLARERKSSSVN